MSDLFSLFPDLQGARLTSSDSDGLMIGPSRQAGSAPQSSPAAPGPGSTAPATLAASAAPMIPAAGSSAVASSSSASVPGSSANTPGPSASAPGSAATASGPSSGEASTVAVSIGPADPDFDGLLVSWNPLSTALERADARAALGLKLRETIHTGSMQASGAGPLEVLDLPAGQAADQALEQLSRRPGIAFAEKNWLIQTQAISNDPAATNGSLWGMYGDSSSPANAFGSQAAEAWSRGFTGSANVVVGIIDEGFQISHPDLIGNHGVNPGEISGNGEPQSRHAHLCGGGSGLCQ